MTEQKELGKQRRREARNVDLESNDDARIVAAPATESMVERV